MSSPRTRWPEKTLGAYVAVMFLLLLGAYLGRMTICSIAFEILALPTGWLLGLGSWYSNLPQEAAYSVSFIAAVANGLLYYGALKITIAVHRHYTIGQRNSERSASP